MMKSKKDYQILKYLVEDARIPLTTLAKKTLLSRESVQYRLKNMEKNIIRGYQARINLNFFADAIYTLFLNIQNSSRQEAIKKLRRLPSVHWVGNSGGRWNYIVTFSTNKENNLENFLNNLFSSFSNKILRYSFAQHIKEYKDTFGGLFGIKEIIISERTIKEKIELDDWDIKIINELTKDASISNLKIAEKLKTTRETIRKRIKYLESQQIILNYRTMINPEELGLENYVLTIKTKTLKLLDIKSLISFFINLSECSYVCVVLGEISIFVTLSVKSLKSLDEISNKIQKEFYPIITEVEPLPLFEIGEQTYEL